MDTLVTRHLFWDDSYTFSCTATVLYATTQNHEGNITVITDCTVMHPQGGGQPADTGVIRSQDGQIVFHVQHVQKSTKDALHIQHIGKYRENSFKGFSVEDKIIIEIDEEKRRLHARLHSGGHLLDGALYNLGVKDLVSSKGYHFPDNPYVEYIGTVSVEKREELIRLLNEEAAKLIAENLLVNVTFEEGLRYVTIAGVKCPCGGTHVKSLKEIGTITATKIKKNKKNIKISYTIS